MDFCGFATRCLFRFAEVTTCMSCNEEGVIITVGDPGILSGLWKLPKHQVKIFLPKTMRVSMWNAME